MLFALNGSSCSGKSTLAFMLAGRLRDVAVHDSDEDGVPDNADRVWRHRTTEVWLNRAAEYQARGIDLILAGQSPLGEILAAPSAPLLDGIAVCLVDVAADAQRDRLNKRDPGRWSASAVEAFVGWAAWHRGHARDPRYRREVIVDGSWERMAWHRWSGWTAEDPRWCTYVLDTTSQSIAHSADQIERWLVEQRELRRSGRLPVSVGWTDVGEP